MEFNPVRGLGSYSIASALRTGAVRYAEREAFYCSTTGRRSSYRELNARTNQLANALTARGLRKGDVVGFVCANRVELVEIYFALAKTGLVGLPLNYRLAAVEMAALLVAMGATGLICEARFGAVLDSVRERAPGVRDLIWIGDSPPDDCRQYETLLAAAPATEPDAIVAESDPYYFNLTSGTTGLPKAYLVSHYNACAIGAMLTFDLREDDVPLIVFPGFGRVAFGWICFTLVRGLRAVLADFHADAVLRLIEQERISYTMLVPTMAAMLLEAPALRRRDLSSLRVVAYVGAPLPAKIRDASIAQLCPQLYEGYGLQESGWLTVSTAADRARKPDSVGQPVLYADVRIVDATGTAVAADTIGEVVARSPGGTTAYFQSPERTTEAFRDGWFHTGDLGRFDADGYLYICGRVKDMIISGGQNIHSAEVEATLLMMPGVRDCAVFGLPDDRWGERVTALLVSDDGAAPTLEQVQEFCRPLIAGFKIPRQVFTQSESLPRTPTGKVQKFRLLERYRTPY
jgi:fatty-acyl-CoA synthase